MEPGRVDAIVDLAYGVLIFVAVVLMIVSGSTVGIAFGLGVLVAYGVHVVWKMARFDPEWMTRAVEQSVEDVVGETVEQSVEDTVEETIEDTVEEAVEEAVDKKTDPASGSDPEDNGT